MTNNTTGLRSALTTLFVLLLVSPGTSLSLAQDGKPGAAELIEWSYSVQQARIRASDYSRQVAVLFETEWCQWCRMLNDSTLSDPRVAKFGERLEFVRVNAEADTVMVAKYRVRAFPTLLLITPEGNEVDRIVGYSPPDEFINTLDDYLDGKGTFWDIEREFKKNLTNTKYMYLMAEKFTLRGDFQEGRGRLRNVIKNDASNLQGWTDDAWFALAKLDREEGEWYKAVFGFQRIIDSFPKSEWRTDAETYIPWLYEQAGDTLQAVTHYRLLRDHRSGSDKVWAEERLRALSATDEE